MGLQISQQRYGSYFLTLDFQCTLTFIKCFALSFALQKTPKPCCWVGSGCSARGASHSWLSSPTKDCTRLLVYSFVPGTFCHLPEGLGVRESSFGFPIWLMNIFTPIHSQDSLECLQRLTSWSSTPSGIAVVSNYVARGWWTSSEHSGLTSPREMAGSRGLHSWITFTSCTENLL